MTLKIKHQIIFYLCTFIGWYILDYVFGIDARTAIIIWGFSAAFNIGYDLIFYKEKQLKDEYK